MNKRLPTLMEVAKGAGVSAMTASRALGNRPGVSQETRNEVLRVAAEMGYVLNRAAQKLSGGNSRIIGVVTQELHNPFISEVIAGVGRAARAASYEMLIYSLMDAEHSPPGSVLQLMGQIADGVIALLPYRSEYIDTLSATSVPVITIEHSGAQSRFPCIVTDNYTGGQLAVQHLAELGHRRIAFITGNERLASARERRRGYNDTLARFGLPRDPTLVVSGDFTQRGGNQAAHRLLAIAKRPTAIFAANDLSALGVLAALGEAGLRVPRDISVVGFDDIPAAAQAHPALTTVRQPMEGMGRSAMNTLLAMIAGLEAAAPRIMLPTELVVRQSTGSLPPRTQARS
ncbi:MAG: LacI family DNA-binding transcriptional regulator [Acetobacteraceae bacterium]|nr:LacI family DNA-binding transcriptional regulator [Acetobacteraceae bacterium]